MLELRPVCEHCAKPLPPAATDAMICSYECAFCARCVAAVLGNVCPNCGGGFAPRPIRTRTAWRNGNGLARDRASTVVRHRPVDPVAHEVFARSIRDIPPHSR